MDRDVTVAAFVRFPISVMPPLPSGPGEISCWPPPTDEPPAEFSSGPRAALCASRPVVLSIRATARPFPHPLNERTALGLYPLQHVPPHLGGRSLAHHPFGGDKHFWSNRDIFLQRAQELAWQQRYAPTVFDFTPCRRRKRHNNFSALPRSPWPLASATVLSTRRLRRFCIKEYPRARAVLVGCRSCGPSSLWDRWSSDAFGSCAARRESSLKD